MSIAFPSGTIFAKSVGVEEYSWQFIRIPGKYLANYLRYDILIDKIEKCACVKW